ncbi:hypothetical protein N9Z87_02060 [Amylibacter sp.]|nr:hypothetical protein [Amylibacter sp.]
MGQPEASSIANYCNKVSLKTSTSGGFVNINTMTDPKHALDEQFCLARIFAIAKSEELVLQVQGVTTAQMEAQCQRLVPAFSQQISAVSISSFDDVVRATGQQIVKSGAQPKQMAFSGSICLGIGYRTDNTELALASALILTSLGQQPYSELMGHQLANGFGTTQRYDLATQWYDNAVEAVKLGQPAVFAQGQAGRMDLIAAASKGMAAAGASGADAPSSAFALPSFD